ncbi:hypothetical protein FTUN_6855 [Frigoriglobus tundricola]|uniref:Uncharacterized protein n=1 Tax=Frigoriglobus tundricola TaxID=2774151 RepID=A0A6M5Z1B0_9BACT|nr:hypothetical protein FTUN_6855 [Frigoriglobus tundricola]
MRTLYPPVGFMEEHQNPVRPAKQLNDRKLRRADAVPHARERFRGA